MKNLSNDELKVLYSVLKNYYVNLYEAISESSKNLYRVEKLPTYYIESLEDEGASMANDCANSCLKLEMKSANLISINKQFLKCTSIEEMLENIKKYNTLKLDKNIIKDLLLQEKFVNSCYKRGYITTHTLNVFSQLTNSIKNYYYNASMQAKICAEYIEHEIRMRENDTVSPDELNLESDGEERDI